MTPAVSLSRRRLLLYGLAAVPGFLAPRLLSASADGGDADLSPIELAYDPDAHAWAFVCDTTKCIGCGLCVEACKLENHIPEVPDANRTWVDLHEVTESGVIVVSRARPRVEPPAAESGAPGANGETGAVTDAYFVPRLCMQCEDPPCVSVCPVSATYRTADGITLVDESRCIGCGYCVVACPYGARYIVPSGGETPKDTPGVADKCTFCYHRITRGRQPACVEVCPVGARQLGDLADPEDPIHELVGRPDASVMNAELGTRPRVRYLGLEAREA